MLGDRNHGPSRCRDSRLWDLHDWRRGYDAFHNLRERSRNGYGGIEAIRASEHVHSVSQMASGFRRSSIPKPGNATREILVVHDGRKQISQPLTSRGFVCTGPINIQDGREYWSLVTNHDRETVRIKLDEVREQMSAEINVRSMKQQNLETRQPHFQWISSRSAS